ncbi:hypothetical protein HY439_03640 [Candidatus Microgenomates bacterium]|nr:hypothetical protein [Candidatus Microgenomates bacterium]
MKRQTSGESYKSVLKLKDGAEIKANLNNWLLVIPPRNRWYFPSLDVLFQELLDYKIKFYASQSEKKTLEELVLAIQKARAEVWEIVNKLTTVKTSVSEQLGVSGGGSELKVD